MIKVAPSVLSADFTRLGEDIADLINGGADYLHLDVMDGMFVPNISFGMPVIRSIRERFADTFLDVHLMIDRPLRYIDAVCDAGADLLTVHIESDTAENIGKTVELIKMNGKKAGISIKPDTPVSAVIPFLDKIDLVLVMTVEPGFGGQRFMADKAEKIALLRQEIDSRGLDCELEVDGGINPETAGICIAAGADVLVAGSAVFRGNDRAERINAIRNGE